MRKLFLLLACALFLLSACSTSADSSDGYGQSDLSLYNAETKKEIHLGMTKEDIEKALGEPLEKTDYFPYYEAPGISIGFRGGTSVLFALRKAEEEGMREDFSGHFKTSRGITVNSSYGDFQKKYPTSIRQDNSFQFYLMREEEGYTDITASFVEDKKPYQDNISSVYYIYFGNADTSPDAKPSSIYVGDYRAIYMADVEK